MTEDCDFDGQERNIKFFIRILPLETECKSCAEIDTEQQVIKIRCLQDLQRSRVETSKEPIYWCFQTDGIFQHVSQEKIYSATTNDLMQKALDGVNCVLISYGQTGAGKSFTVGGLRNSWEHRGLVTRFLSDMFAEKTNRRRVSRIRYCLSFVELRGRDVTDLLICDAKSRIKVNERDAFKNVTMLNMANEEETLQHIFEGETRRAIVKGSNYPVSHLGTAVITFHVWNESLTLSSAVIATAKIHIVEMAGTGTVGKSNCTKPAVDVGMANLMRTQLEQFFVYLRGVGVSARSIVRTSNLLKILGNALCVHSVIRLIAHVRLTEEDLDVSLSTLRFGSKVGRFRPIRTMRNIEEQPESIIRKLQAEVEVLKQELDVNDMLFNQEASTNISKLRAEQINRDIHQFLDGTISDITLFNVSQIQVLLKIIKDLYNKLTVRQSEMEKLSETYQNAINSGHVASSFSASNGKTNQTGSARMRKRSKNFGSGSTYTLVESKEPKKKQQVGELHHIGVTLGPNANDGYVDTEASDAKTDKHTRLSKKIAESALILPDHDRDVFEHFIREDQECKNLMESYDKNENVLKELHQAFTAAIEKYSATKQRLETSRIELNKQQQIRHNSEKEEYDAEGRILVSETERNLVQDLMCLEKVLTHLEADVSQLQQEVRTLQEQQTDIRAKVEAAFEEYCKNVEVAPISNIESRVSKRMTEALTENVKNTFEKLQRIMIKMIEGKQQMKKVQKDCDDV